MSILNKIHALHERRISKKTIKTFLSQLNTLGKIPDNWEKVFNYTVEFLRVADNTKNKLGNDPFDYHLLLDTLIKIYIPDDTEISYDTIILGGIFGIPRFSLSELMHEDNNYSYTDKLLRIYGLFGYPNCFNNYSLAGLLSEIQLKPYLTNAIALLTKVECLLHI